jgi:uncharacterized membrane protein
MGVDVMHKSVNTEYMDFSLLIDGIGKIIDCVGVIAIVLGIIFAILHFAKDMWDEKKSNASYETLRQNLGRTIIIGLELLIAGDIIRSIAVPPNFTTVGVLAIVVLIRSFLTIQIGNESEWHFPWNHQNRNHENRPPHTWRIKT